MQIEENAGRGVGGGGGGGWGGGYSPKFYLGRLCPEIHPLTLVYIIFNRKGIPFIYLQLTNQLILCPFPIPG